MRDQPCKVDGCDRSARSRGMCTRHDNNERYYGRAVPRRDQPLDERLGAVGWTVTESGCWEWGGKRNDQGYGIFNARRLGYEGVRAHRVVFQHLTGRQLSDDELCHRCDNPPCVNPEHMFVGTHEENMEDMSVKGRTGGLNPATCPNGHDRTKPGATEVVRRKGRKTTEEACVQCRRDRIARYRRRIKARSSAR